MSSSLNTPQPPPTEGEGPEVWPLIYDSTRLVLPDWLRADMRERHELGRAKYGTGLRVWNGRDCAVDAYQEALDLAVYLTQAQQRIGSPGLVALNLARHQALQLCVWLGQLAREAKVPVQP